MEEGRKEVENKGEQTAAEKREGEARKKRRKER